MSGASRIVAGIVCLGTLAAGGAEIRIVHRTPEGPRLLATTPDLPSAQRRVRELKGEGRLLGPVEVQIPPGTQILAAPLRFGPEDSGTSEAPVIYCGTGPTPATISGGRTITGWRDAGNGIWQAEIPEAREGRLYFRQLFVNGRRAIRARSPNRGFHHTTGLIRTPEHATRKADGFYFAGTDLDAELVSDPDLLVVLYQSWLSRQYRVKELRPESKAVLLDPEVDAMRVRSRYLIENSLACLDAPGEWHLERRTGILRYLPMRGEDMTKAEVVAPALPSLLQFRGDPENGAYVEHLHFRDLRFAHADWTPQGRSISGGQARCPTGFADPAVALESGAVSAIGLRHSSFEGCEITQVGAHALALLQGCRDNLLRRCHLHDLGGGGVYLCWAIPQPDGKRDSWRPRGEFDHIVRNSIDNCYIHDLTHVFHGSVGVLTGPCAAFNRITHNEISHGDYTGISVGWGWSANQKNGYVQDGNVVEYNHVHHQMNYLLDDGGGIYLLGWQKDARVCHNYIHDVRHDPLGHGAKGIYPDQGTAGVLFEGNVVHDVVQGFGGNGGHECTVRHNIFAFSQKSGVIGGSKWWYEQVRYNPNPIVFEGNIVYQPEGGMVMRTGYSADAQVARSNLYWAGANGEEAGLFSGEGVSFAPFAEWQAKGHDRGTILADPLFVDAAGRDFRLRPDSPARGMGFQETDLSKVGLYGDPGWTSVPRTAKHAPIAPSPGPGPFEWTYEDETAGAPPVHSGQLAAGPAELGHRIEVTDRDAASGRHCLMLAEGRNSERGFFPFLHYPVGIAEGRVRATCRVKLPAATPSAFYLSFRDYDNTGASYFQAGPHIEVAADGTLAAPGEPDLRIALPRDQWIGVELAFSVGEGAPMAFELTLAVPGQPPRTIPAIPFRDAGFRQVGDLYLVSTGPDGGAFLVDDVRLEVGE